MDRIATIVQCVCMLITAGLMVLVAWAVGVRLEQFASRLDRVESSITASGKAVKVVDELKRRGLVVNQDEAARVRSGGE
jgi:membrane-bound ClpP family serine protease